MDKKLLVVIFFVSIASYAYIDEDVIEYYVNLMTTAYRNGLTYRWPSDAYEHFASGQREKYGTYDFVVIGAGAGGSVAANRLSEVANWRVLLLEAGEYGRTLTDIPDNFSPIQFTKYNWAYNSTPQTTACLGLINRQCLYPRGKGMGGSSLINGLVYSRGHAADFDHWAELVGNKRWGYDSVLNYYKKSEHYVHNNHRAPSEPEFHGKGGYNRVEYHVGNSPQLYAFLEANKELNLGIADYNANQLGASPSQLNTIYGTRLHNAKAFLYPIVHRPNLDILPDSFVTKIRIVNDDNHFVATGVEFSHKGQKYFVDARKEVILCAGAFGSAQILMLSGIGPRKHLQSVGIDVVQDLEVGSTLRDHPTFYGLNFVTNYTEPVRPYQDYIVQFLKGVGPLTVPASNQGVGFYESSYTKGTGIPDIELMMLPANATNMLSQRSFGFTDQTYEDTWKFNDIPRSFIVYVIALHPKSVGTIRLKSKDPYQYPLIDSNFLSDPEDRDINTLYEGIQLVLRLIQTKAFRAMDTKSQGRLRACRQFLYGSRRYWYCALRQLTIDLYHPMGTCPMGRDPTEGAVVDSELKVFGVEGLRVADASVFPSTPAGHTNAPAVMVGEQLGDLVKMTHKDSIIRFWDDIFI